MLFFFSFSFYQRGIKGGTSKSGIKLRGRGFLLPGEGARFKGSGSNMFEYNE
jgi:hypothetical protein